MARETLLFFCCRSTSWQCDELCIYSLLIWLLPLSEEHCQELIHEHSFCSPCGALQQWGAASLGIAGTLNLLVVRHFVIMLTGMRQYPLGWVAQSVVTGIKERKICLRGHQEFFLSHLVFSDCKWQFLFSSPDSLFWMPEIYLNCFLSSLSERICS